jgi:hypothetical protein
MKVVDKKRSGSAAAFPLRARDKTGTSRAPGRVEKFDMLTAEKIAEFQQAVKEAHAAPCRRRSPRIKHECYAEASRWKNGKAGESFTVVLENVSTTGVGIRHSDRLRAGEQYLLQIPRPGGPLTNLFTVTHCGPCVGGSFQVALEPEAVLEVANGRTSVFPGHDTGSGSSSGVKVGLVLFTFIATAVAAAFLFVY